VGIQNADFTAAEADTELQGLEFEPDLDPPIERPPSFLEKPRKRVHLTMAPEANTYLGFGSQMDNCWRAHLEKAKLARNAQHAPNHRVPRRTKFLSGFIDFDEHQAQDGCQGGNERIRGQVVFDGESVELTSANGFVSVFPLFFFSLDHFPHQFSALCNCATIVRLNPFCILLFNYKVQPPCNIVQTIVLDYYCLNATVLRLCVCSATFYQNSLVFLFNRTSILYHTRSVIAFDRRIFVFDLFLRLSLA